MEKIYIIGTQHGVSEDKKLMTSVMDKRVTPDFYRNFKDVLLSPSTILVPEGFSSLFSRKRLVNSNGKNYKKVRDEVFGCDIETKCIIQLVDSRKRSIRKAMGHFTDTLIRLGNIHNDNGKCVIGTIENFKKDISFKKKYEFHKKSFAGYADRIEEDVYQFILKNRLSNPVVVIVGSYHVEKIKNKLLEVTHHFETHQYIVKDDDDKLDIATQRGLQEAVFLMLVTGSMWKILDSAMYS